MHGHNNHIVPQAWLKRGHFGSHKIWPAHGGLICLSTSMVYVSTGGRRVRPLASCNQ